MNHPIPVPQSAPPIAPPAAKAAWSVDAVLALFELPFADLMFRAQQTLRENFDPNAIQRSTLLSIKTGNCSEDCSYCSQSKRYQTGLETQRLLSTEEVLAAARAAKEQGSGRFCMGAAWRGPKQRDLEQVKQMIGAVKALGMETCGTFGMLKPGQAQQLKDSGLDYYNHNLDTAPDKYADIVGTRAYEDRLDTLRQVREAGLNVCCGGIVGMGETREQRAGLIAELANLDPQPESVPINNLVQVPGTPLNGAEEIDWSEFVRTIAVARIAMPTSLVRLSAGRQQMPEAMQALCFLAGANSIFYGEKLLTTGNPQADQDRALLAKLDMSPL